MRKTLKVIVAAVLLVAMMFSMTAFAEPSQREMLTLRCMVAAANQSIRAMVRVAQKTPYNDVPYLLAAVDCTTAPVFAYANKIGATVVCEYEYYMIDGQYVAIDPLKVINGTRTDN